MKADTMTNDQLETLAGKAGMYTDLFRMGAASMVYSPGCEGVALDELKRFAELVLESGRASYGPAVHWIPSTDGLSFRNPAPDASVPMVPSRSIQLQVTAGMAPQTICTAEASRSRAASEPGEVARCAFRCAQPCQHTMPSVLASAPQPASSPVAAERDFAFMRFPELYGGSPEAPVAAEGQKAVALTWYEGEPPFPQNQEWFIAETIYGDRVVLMALPKEYSYDYKTADQTYMKAGNVKRWMQFPDCEYVPPSTATPTASMANAAEAVAEVVGTHNIRTLKFLPAGVHLPLGTLLYATPGPRGENAGGAWISVDERLPPACTEVIARGRPYGTNKTILSCESITYISTHPRECVEDDEITHWRLPDRGLRIAEKGDAS